MTGARWRVTFGDQMKIAALLPNVEIYGGVRRYLELGNALVRRGHEYTLFTPAGEKPDWLEFRGRSTPFEALSGLEFDVGIAANTHPAAVRPPPGRGEFFDFVLEGHKMEKVVARRNYRFLGSSEGICRRIERKYGVNCHRAPGGINPDVFHPVPRGALQAGDGAAVRPASPSSPTAASIKREKASTTSSAPPRPFTGSTPECGSASSTAWSAGTGATPAR